MKHPALLRKRLLDQAQIDAEDEFAALVLAAREDESFRKRVMAIINLPAPQRESLVRSAVEEMKLRGEPRSVRTAFLALATIEGADTVARLIKSE